MKKQFKLGVIGCGFEAKTVLRGVVLSEFLRERKIIVSDFGGGNIEDIEDLGVNVTDDNRFIAETCEFLLIAVQPKELDGAIKSLGGFKHDKIISVVDGVNKSTIKNAVGLGAIKVARATINIPASVGSGAIGLDMSDYNGSLDDTEFISGIFNCLGTVVSLPESKIGAASALNCGGLVQVYMFIDALTESGAALGLSKNEAKILAVQTVLGAAELVQREDNSLEELLMQACKGSSAIEAVKLYEGKDMRGIVKSATEACANRVKTDK